MPAIKKGESRDDYLKRCIPYCVDSEGMTPEAAKGKCEGMYDQHIKKGTNYSEYTFTAELHVIENSANLQPVENTSDGKLREDENWIHMRATAVIGDRMMNGVYVPYNELKKSVNLWNGTYHDLSHLGTSYPGGFMSRENLEYVVGYQDNSHANDQTKEITMDVHVNKNSPKYSAWKSFIDINKAAGKIPNVSMSVQAKSKMIRASDCEASALAQDEMVPSLMSIIPVALTTCLKGVCSDAKGCGLCTHSEEENMTEKEFSVWDTAYVNNLPDSAFAYIESGGSKDEENKTVPRSLRHFPYKGSDGKVDLPHLRNALARAPQSPFGEKAMNKLRAAAKEAGIGDYAEKCDCDSCKCNQTPVSGADEDKKNADYLAEINKRIKQLKEEN